MRLTYKQQNYQTLRFVCPFSVTELPAFYRVYLITFRLRFKNKSLKLYKIRVYPLLELEKKHENLMLGIFISAHSYFSDERTTNDVYKNEFQFFLIL